MQKQFFFPLNFLVSPEFDSKHTTYHIDFICKYGGGG